MSSDVLPAYPPKTGRAHEVCGAGAYMFALTLAAQARTQVIWVREAWRIEQINPVGVATFFDPNDLLLAVAKDQKELLAVAEEALRSGATPLVIMELSQPLGLTEGRRLQLAARDGSATGLCVIPEGMGSNAAETRWRCAPIYDPTDSTLQRWDLIKNKTGTLGAWNVRWDRASHRVCVVSPAGE